MQAFIAHGVLALIRCILICLQERERKAEQKRFEEMKKKQKLIVRSLS